MLVLSLSDHVWRGGAERGVRRRDTRLQGDLIILGRTPPLSSEDSMPMDLPPSTLPRETLLARYAFSQALSRSTALSGLETALDHYLSSVALLPRTLQKTGKPGLGRRELVMKLGELLRFRQGLNLNRENFSDTPDFYWSEPVLEGEWLSCAVYGGGNCAYTATC